MATKKKTTVIFISQCNSSRSQMAEALLRSIAGECFEVYSAGTSPEEINPYAEQVMEEAGISIKSSRSKSVMEYFNQKFDIVITVCDSALNYCPMVKGDLFIHKGFQDPGTMEYSAEDPLDQFRKVRNQITEWLNSEFAAACGNSLTMEVQEV